ncbi:recombinase family protein [Marinigracilibium pacificum]|uniref:Recombinase family protein n=1 Tax=Marinigracilibium pacificum TaxID=2729599 RepID=A0A848J7B4_9BACT|nr:recombinase family protein [Marinigracilibium pacificum]NMM50324.1 recombinase family protein [Marinigracilibium pacificum]
MKSIIYTRVSSKDQSTKRQLNDMKSISGFEVAQVFSEKISAFNKSSFHRPVLQKALLYAYENDVKCVMISEVSRIGRNTVDVLNIIEDLKQQEIAIYIHNLGTTINKGDHSGNIFTKLIVTIMADLARLESEQLSYRIKSGIRARKARGLTTGRKVGSKESEEKFLTKHQDIIKYLSKGYSSREIQKLCKCSPNTIRKVKMNLITI